MSNTFYLVFLKDRSDMGKSYSITWIGTPAGRGIFLTAYILSDRKITCRITIVIFIFCQIEGQTLDVPAGQQPPNPTAKCPIYRWNLQHKYNYTVNAFTGSNNTIISHIRERVLKKIVLLTPSGCPAVKSVHQVRWRDVAQENHWSLSRGTSQDCHLCADGSQGRSVLLSFLFVLVAIKSYSLIYRIRQSCFHIWNQTNFICKAHLKTPKLLIYIT